MSLALGADELISLIDRVFQPRQGETCLGFLVDLPDDEVPDDEAWMDRREMVREWAQALKSKPECALEPRVIVYRNAGANNADLPDDGYVYEPGEMPAHTRDLDAARARPMEDLLEELPFLLAPTRFSATAPLKVAARKLMFRGATMPGFRRSMIPALRLDWEEVEKRVRLLAERLDRAIGAEIRFRTSGGETNLYLDLRYRLAHVSGGLVRTPGQAGNLPSGEAYIVPYEGERENEPSKTEGILPVELDGEVVRYRFSENRAVEVLSGGEVSAREAAKLAAEPAYGNLAELGLGVLRDLGVNPVGEVLLDEKLGLHLAFGRSEHFGGQVGPEDFTSPRAVIHIDRVYLPELQPSISVAYCDLRYPEGDSERILAADRYTIDWQ